MGPIWILSFSKSEIFNPPSHTYNIRLFSDICKFFSTFFHYLDPFFSLKSRKNFFKNLQMSIFSRILVGGPSLFCDPKNNSKKTCFLIQDLLYCICR